MIRTLLALARAARDPALQDPSVSNVEDEDLDEAARRSRAPAKADLTTLPTTNLQMSNADEDALRAIRAASPALQEWWPDGESPRSWEGITWGDDRVRRLNFEKSGLEVLAPQIGQLQALTWLVLSHCPLKRSCRPRSGSC